MTPDLRSIIRLQGIDQRILELQREIAALPKHIAEIEKKLENHARKLEIDRAALVANQKERKRLEGEIQVFEQKISKLKGQMLEAKTNEQYRAFQNEIAYAEREIRKAEDLILDRMSEAEPLEQAVKAAETALKAEQAEVEAEKAMARKRTAEDQGFLAELQKQRQELVGSISGAALSTYERIRKKWHGSVVAEATEGRCTACQITLRPQFFQDLRRGDQLMTCESCGRIVYYNPPVSFEADVPQPVG